MLVACGGDDSESITTDSASYDTTATDDTTSSSNDPLSETAIWDYLDVAVNDLPFDATAYPTYVEGSEPRTLRINVTTDEPEDLTPVCQLIADYIDTNAPGEEIRIEVNDDLDLVIKAVREVDGECSAAS